jgi:hypothetical protein
MNLNNWSKVVLGIFAITVAGVAVLGTLTLLTIRDAARTAYDPGLQEPALTYVEDEGFIKHVTVPVGCPLPPFTYTVRVREPILASAYVTWVEGTTGNFGAQTGDDRARFWPYIEAGEWPVSVGEGDIPDRVTPGLWRRIVVAQSENAAIAWYVQFVTVEPEAECPEIPLQP